MVCRAILDVEGAAWTTVHAHWLLLLVLVHVAWLLLLLVVVPRQHLLLLLIHILERWLHPVRTPEAVHLILSEVVHHVAFVHAVGVLLVGVEAAAHALVHLPDKIELHVRAVGRHGESVVNASVASHMARNVHIWTIGRVWHLL